MPPRRQSGGRAGKRKPSAKTLAGIAVAAIAVGAIAIAAYHFYQNRSEIGRFFARPRPADAATVERAIDDAYSRINPVKTSTSTVNVAGREIRRDRLELPKTVAIARANAEIATAVEAAGGEVAYGVESSDENARKVGVTIGVSVGKRLVREIRLEKTARK
jgi:hypothetical protein